MSNLIPGNQKHLTLNDRLYIEHALDEGRSFRDIAKYLCKDPTTISREVRLHRSLDTWHKGSFNNPYNFCIHRFKCRKTNVCKKLLICDQKCASCHKCNQVCDRFEKEACRHLDKAPFVCNGCGKARNLCSIPTMLILHSENTRSFARLPERVSQSPEPRFIVSTPSLTH